MNACGCCRGSHRDIHITSDLWSCDRVESLTVNVVAELGEASLTWFDDLTESYLANQEMADGVSDLPSDGSALWSPCPRGGLFLAQGGSRCDADVTPITAMISLSDSFPGLKNDSATSSTHHLGLDHLGSDQLEVKWTSAMATPTQAGLSSCFNKTAMEETAYTSASPCGSKQKMLNRKLFSPMDVSYADDSLSRILNTFSDRSISTELENTLTNNEDDVGENKDTLGDRRQMMDGMVQDADSNSLYSTSLGCSAHEVDDHSEMEDTFTKADISVKLDNYVTDLKLASGLDSSKNNVDVSADLTDVDMLQGLSDSVMADFSTELDNSKTKVGSLGLDYPSTDLIVTGCINFSESSADIFPGNISAKELNEQSKLLPSLSVSARTSAKKSNKKEKQVKPVGSPNKHLPGSSSMSRTSHIEAVLSVIFASQDNPKQQKEVDIISDITSSTNQKYGMIMECYGNNEDGSRNTTVYLDNLEIYKETFRKVEETKITTKEENNNVTSTENSRKNDMLILDNSSNHEITTADINDSKKDKIPLTPAFNLSSPDIDCGTPCNTNDQGLNPDLRKVTIIKQKLDEVEGQNVEKRFLRKRPRISQNVKNGKKRNLHFNDLYTGDGCDSFNSEENSISESRSETLNTSECFNSEENSISESRSETLNTSEFLNMSEALKTSKKICDDNRIVTSGKNCDGKLTNPQSILKDPGKMNAGLKKSVRFNIESTSYHEFLSKSPANKGNSYSSSHDFVNKTPSSHEFFNTTPSSRNVYKTNSSHNSGNATPVKNLRSESILKLSDANSAAAGVVVSLTELYLGGKVYQELQSGVCNGTSTNGVSSNIPTYMKDVSVSKFGSDAEKYLKTPPFEGQVPDQCGNSFNDSLEISPTFSSQALLSSKTEGALMVLGAGLSDNSNFCSEDGGIVSPVFDPKEKVTSLEIHTVGGGCPRELSASSSKSSIGTTSEDFSLDDGDDETFCAAAIQVEKAESERVYVEVMKVEVAEHQTACAEAPQGMKDEPAAAEVDNAGNVALEEGLVNIQNGDSYGIVKTQTDKHKEGQASNSKSPVNVTYSKYLQVPERDFPALSSFVVNPISSPSTLHQKVLSSRAGLTQASASSVYTPVPTPSVHTFSSTSTLLTSPNQHPLVSTSFKNFPASVPLIAKTKAPTFPAETPTSSIFHRKHKRFQYPSCHKIKEESTKIATDLTINVTGDTVSPLKLFSKSETLATKMVGEIRDHVGSMSVVLPHANQSGQEEISLCNPDRETQIRPPRKISKLSGFAKFSDLLQTSVHTLETKSFVCQATATASGGDRNSYSNSGETSNSSAAEPDDEGKSIMTTLNRKRVTETAAPTDYQISSNPTSRCESSHFGNVPELASAKDLVKSAPSPERNVLKSETVASSKVDEDIYMASQVWSQSEFSQMLVSDTHDHGLQSKNVLADIKDHKTSGFNKSHKNYTSALSAATISSCVVQEDIKQLTPKANLRQSIMLEPSPASHGQHANSLSGTDLAADTNLESQLKDIFKGMKQKMKSSGSKFKTPFLKKRHQDEEQDTSHLLNKKCQGMQRYPLHQYLKATGPQTDEKLQRLVGTEKNCKLTEFEKLLVKMEFGDPGADDSHAGVEVKIPSIASGNGSSLSLAGTSLNFETFTDNSSSLCSDYNTVSTAPVQISDLAFVKATEGFSTASGKCISVSENARDQARRILHGATEVNDDDNDDLKHVVASGYKKGSQLFPVAPSSLPSPHGFSNLGVNNSKEPSNKGININVCDNSEDKPQHVVQSTSKDSTLTLITETRPINLKEFFSNESDSSVSKSTDPASGDVSRSEKAMIPKGFLPFKSPRVLRSVATEQTQRESLRERTQNSASLSRNTNKFENVISSKLTSGNVYKTLGAHDDDDWEDDSSFQDLLLVGGDKAVDGSDKQAFITSDGICCQLVQEDPESNHHRSPLGPTHQTPPHSLILLSDVCSESNQRQRQEMDLIKDSKTSGKAPGKQDQATEMADKEDLDYGHSSLMDGVEKSKVVDRSDYVPDSELALLRTDIIAQKHVELEVSSSDLPVPEKITSPLDVLLEDEQEFTVAPSRTSMAGTEAKCGKAKNDTNKDMHKAFSNHYQVISNTKVSQLLDSFTCDSPRVKNITCDSPDVKFSCGSPSVTICDIPSVITCKSVLATSSVCTDSSFCQDLTSTNRQEMSRLENITSNSSSQEATNDRKDSKLNRQDVEPVARTTLSPVTSSDMTQSGDGKSTVSGISLDKNVDELKTMSTKNLFYMQSGFSATSGINVSIPEKSWKHARNFLNESSSDKDMPVIVGKNTKPLPGFSTVSGVNVSVSEKSLEHARNFLNESSGCEKETEISGNAQRLLQGFSTASGVKVSVSETSLEHAKSFLNESTEAEKEQEIVGKSRRKMNVSHGFSTASRKKVSVTENALEQAKSFLGGFDVPEKEDSGIIENNTKTMPGFLTTREIKSSLSGNVLDCSRSFLMVSDETGHGIKSNISAGFSTASGTKMSVSEKALNHARNLFADPDLVDGDGKTASGLSNNSAIGQSGKIYIKEPFRILSDTLKITEQSLEGSRNIQVIAADLGVPLTNVSNCKKVDSTCLELSESVTSNMEHATNNRFDGGAGSSSCLSRLDDIKDDASDKLILPGCKKDCTVDVITDKNTANSCIQGHSFTLGFTTAGGSKVLVSKEALHHAKGLLGDKENLSTTSTVTCVKPSPANVTGLPLKSLPGLANHSNTSVASLTTPSSVSKGFSTASGSSVTVSEKALKQAHIFLEDMDGDNRTDVSTVLGSGDGSISQFEDLPTDHFFDKMSKSNVSQLDKSHMTPGGQRSSPLKAARSLGHNTRFKTPLRSDCEKFRFDRQKTRGRTLSALATVPPTAQQGITVKPPTLTSFKPPQKKSLAVSSCSVAVPNISATVYTNSITSCGIVSPNISATAHTNSITSCSTSTTSPVAFKHIISPGKELGLMTPDSSAVFVIENHQSNIKPQPTHTENMLVAEFGEMEDEEENRLLCQDFDIQEFSSFCGTRDNLDYQVFSCLSDTRNNFHDSENPGDKVKSFNPDLPVNARTSNLSAWPPRKSLDHEAVSTSSAGCGQVLSEVAIEETRMKQEKIIRSKKGARVSPHAGRWLETRKQKKSPHTFNSLGITPTTDLTKQELQSFGVQDSTLEVGAENAKSFRFDLCRFYPALDSGVLVGDGALLVPDKHGYAGVEEFYRAFLTIYGVDPKLVDQVWVENHYRWIVWKLAAYEVCFPCQFAARCLSPEIVMLQLKYRYDREVDGCQRSALKKIVERDDTPSKRMVLLVASVKTMGNDQFCVELTDGWYSIPAQLDNFLTELVARKKIRSGDKIVSSGAELIGCPDGCSPLELKEGTMLKLCGNSTRRAPWHSRLGFFFPPSALCVPVSSLNPSGGVVSCLDVVVCKKYPVMEQRHMRHSESWQRNSTDSVVKGCATRLSSDYMEKLQDGACVFRTIEDEDKARQKYEDEKQVQMEKIYNSLQKEMEDNLKGTKSGGSKKRRKDVESLWTGQDLAAALEEDCNPEELQQAFSASQMDRLMKYKQAEMERKQQEMNRRLQDATTEACKPRNIVPVQKFKVSGCCRRDLNNDGSCLLVVWRPGPEWMEAGEGKRYKLYNVSVSSGRGRFDKNKVMLTTSRQTRLQAHPVNENLLGLIYSPREVWTVSELLSQRPAGDEFDFVGVVLQVVGPFRPQSPTCVFAADINKELLCIKFWSSPQNVCLRLGQSFVAYNLFLSKNSQCSSAQITADVRCDLTCFSSSGHSSRYSQMFDQIIRLSKIPGFLPDLQAKIQVSPWEPSSSRERHQQGFTSKMEDLPPEVVDGIFLPMSQGSWTCQSGNRGRLLTLESTTHNPDTDQHCSQHPTLKHVLPSHLTVNSGNISLNKDNELSKSSVPADSATVSQHKQAGKNCLESPSQIPGTNFHMMASDGVAHHPDKKFCSSKGDMENEIENSSSLMLINKRRSMLRAKMSRLLTYESPFKLPQIMCNNSPASSQEFKFPSAKKL